MQLVGKWEFVCSYCSCSLSQGSALQKFPSGLALVEMLAEHVDLDKFHCQQKRDVHGHVDLSRTSSFLFSAGIRKVM